MGLQSHVVERKCKPRMKKKAEEPKKTNALFTSSDVVSMSAESRRQQNHVTIQNPETGRGHVVVQNGQKNYQNQESFILLQERIQNTQNPRPLGFNQKICGTRGVSESTDMQPNPKKTPHNSNFTQPVCTSFLCSSRDKNVTELCASCKETNDLLLPDSRTHLLSLPTTDNPISLNNPVPLNAQTANKGGAIRDMKNCKRTVKLIKTAKNPNVNLQNSKQSSNENNDGDGFQINRIVLKIKKELWEQVKMERDQSVE
ncbi:uncharacterized protein LOC110852243 isoform X1 [Folsomia candida]|nr:uncharacterized protein LOC110852243 isoform X1 [Folsomia candida]